MSAHLTPAQIKSRLDHPIIDADGHWIEYGPGLHRAAAQGRRRGRGARLERGRRRHARRAGDVGRGAAAAPYQPGGVLGAIRPKNTRDFATAVFPRLLYERLDEIGLDFAIIYPTGGLRVPRVGDGEARRAACRAYNIVTAEYFRHFADRMTPAAIIPMHTPEEAIEELEYAVKQLGYKVAMLGSLMDRPVEACGKVEGEAARFAVWHDVIGLDSEYDYDPVWAKCLELGIAPSFHSGHRRAGLRSSPSNFTYNHIGHFAAANHAACKAMFLGGVTRRFPGLNMSFLEGGSGWACHALRRPARRIGRSAAGKGSKRSTRAISTAPCWRISPASTAATRSSRRLRERDGWPYPGDEKLTGGVADLDDYSACKITRKEDWRDLFVTPFYFGCEADDPSNVWAFNAAPTRSAPGSTRSSARISAISTCPT